mmetsp:Transcript_13870/g.26806  ORF Transcript_13870/g.26806 Transcript_13870/m.26806 type:complete len:130 (+) Transcript_13870:281-670(+)
MFSASSAIQTHQGHCEEKSRGEDAKCGDSKHNSWGEDDTNEQGKPRGEVWRNMSRADHLQCTQEGRAHLRLQQRRLMRMASSSSEGTFERREMGTNLYIEPTGDMQKFSKSRAARRTRAAHKAAFAVAA